MVEHRFSYGVSPETLRHVIDVQPATVVEGFPGYCRHLQRGCGWSCSCSYRLSPQGWRSHGVEQSGGIDTQSLACCRLDLQALQDCWGSQHSSSLASQFPGPTNCLAHNIEGGGDEYGRGSASGVGGVHAEYGLTLGLERPKPKLSRLVGLFDALPVKRKGEVLVTQRPPLSHLIDDPHQVVALAGRGHQPLVTLRRLEWARKLQRKGDALERQQPALRHVVWSHILQELRSLVREGVGIVGVPLPVYRKEQQFLFLAALCEDRLTAKHGLANNNLRGHQHPNRGVDEVLFDACVGQRSFNVSARSEVLLKRLLTLSHLPLLLSDGVSLCQPLPLEGFTSRLKEPSLPQVARLLIDNLATSALDEPAACEV